MSERFPINGVDQKAHDFQSPLSTLFELVGSSYVVSKRGIRVTAILFPADDKQRAVDIELTLEKLANKVDYLLVVNVEKSRERLDAWNRSKL
ncbi:hypothetical protein EM20IM_06085 [Candidatus Methylacidiphilum infernorum]|uniref:Uncharacterized protein n=1 Tax=Candidatus Methylacidiphilum infernorum TaxID=511746 RepID=A0ABX7PTD0_9BACT|nr:hypothetical protein [Candidatus Methylacidiphilum infernorum]QSR86080.1 hypothetical protein EM20IM_06085 [Candidatus Methylacidiphilum infernorum]